METPGYTKDWSDADMVAACLLSTNLKMRDPIDLWMPMMNESGLYAAAQNRSAFAAGLNQQMPFILRGEGFTGDAGYQEVPGEYASTLKAYKAAPIGSELAANLKHHLRELDKALSDAFCRVGVTGQLPWVERYFRPYAGRMANATAVYMANFCPAWLSHATEPGFRICGLGGESDGGLSPAASKLWYSQNAGLDQYGADGRKDGIVTVSDLTLVIRKACTGPRWEEWRTRFLEAQAGVAPPSVQEKFVEVAGDPMFKPKNSI